MSDDFSKEGDSFRNEYNQIQSPSDAWDLAYMEKDHGRDAALKHEEALEKGYANEQEQYNAEVAELLVKQFPNAFRELVNEKTGEKIYVAGLSIFDREPGRYKTTKESVDFIESNRPLMTEINMSNDDIARNLLYSYNNAGYGMFISPRAGIGSFINVPNPLNSELMFDLMEHDKGHSVPIPLKEMSIDRQDRLLRVLDFVDKYAQKLDKEDLNTFDALKARIQAIKNQK